MKFVLLSDCHLASSNPIGRIDDVLETSIEKFKFILDYAVKKKAVILQAADFLDSSRSWLLHSRLLSLFTSNIYKSICMYTIYGQHDTYMYSEESKQATSLGALIQSGYLELLGEIPIAISDCHIYGCSFGHNVPVARDLKKTNILVIHAPILSKVQFDGQKHTKAIEFLMKNKNYDVILTGDIHQKFLFKKDGRYILNTGPLMRLEADEYNMGHSPCLAIFDSDEFIVEFVEIPHLPFDQILTRKHIERSKMSKEILDEFVKSVKKSEFSGIDFFKNLNSYFAKNKIREEVVEAINNERFNGRKNNA